MHYFVCDLRTEIHLLQNKTNGPNRQIFNCSRMINYFNVWCLDFIGTLIRARHQTCFFFNIICLNIDFIQLEQSNCD